MLNLGTEGERVACPQVERLAPHHQSQSAADDIAHFLSFMGQRTFAAGTWRKYMQMTFEEVALSTRNQPLRPGADAVDPDHRSFAGARDDPGVIHRRQQRGQRHLQPVSYSMENGKRWVGVTVLEL